MEEAVYDGMGDGGISQCLSPLLKADAGGDDHGDFFVASAHQVEEQAGILWFAPDVVHMVDDQQIKTGEPGDHIIGGVISQGGIEA